MNKHDVSPMGLVFPILETEDYRHQHISITGAHLLSCLVPSLDLTSTTKVMVTACLSTAVRGITLT